MSNEVSTTNPQESAKIRYTVEVDYELNDVSAEDLKGRILGVLSDPEVGLHVFNDPEEVASINDYTIEVMELPSLAADKMVKLEEYALRCSLMHHLSEIPSNKTGQEILDMIATGESFDELTVWSPYEMDEPEELLEKIETMKDSFLQDFMKAHEILSQG